MRRDEVAHHTGVQSGPEDRGAKMVDPALIGGKKLPLPVESSVASGWRSCAVRSGPSSRPD
jgi:hypothetical protein